MWLSILLNKIGIEAVCVDEKEFTSLGLASYNDCNSCTCTFIDNEIYIKAITDNISMVLVNNQIGEILKYGKREYGICIVDNPRLTFFMLHNYLSECYEYRRRDKATQIGDSADINKLASISDTNVVIGNNVKIEEFVVIRENTIIGDNTIIRSGCNIGGQGFEFKRDNDSIISVKHVGGVIIGSNSEIQCNTCVDRAIYPWDDTIIGEYTKIDNLVHIGHAAKIGKRGMIVANAGIGGRVSIGNDVWIGFGVTVRNGIKIGNNARANMGAVITKNIGDGESYTGNFAVPHEEFINKLRRRT